MDSKSSKQHQPRAAEKMDLSSQNLSINDYDGEDEFQAEFEDLPTPKKEKQMLEKAIEDRVAQAEQKMRLELQERDAKLLEAISGLRAQQAHQAQQMQQQAQQDQQSQRAQAFGVAIEVESGSGALLFPPVGASQISQATEKLQSDIECKTLMVVIPGWVSDPKSAFEDLKRAFAAQGLQTDD